ncbi:unnamed protein product [Rotaria sordida]|uniref:Methyltransferase domain-containing protein n=1 Tax=Rotaria sordida TaxID=392033 RepID=A0A814J1H2_9BILA|nr:unnamed protein product [Rotaria sordida]
MELINIIIWLCNEIQTIYYMILSPIRGITHKERLESFYAGQAKNYDSYRKKLLACRETLLDKLPCGGIWVDMGCGTGYNVEYMAKLGRLKYFTKVYLVDLSPSLLKIAVQRIKENGWTNVEIIETDATNWQPKEQKIDLITFSYSLTMIPDWFLAIDNAKKILKVDGHIGVTDFYVSRKYPEHGFTSHAWFCLYSQKIVFNCTWEDPLLDIEALKLSEKDNLVAITSAGCNILTYVLQKPNHIYAIDKNPCQNAILELKIACIKELDFATNWEIWGHGKLRNFSQNVYPRLRVHLSQEARIFWDSHKHYFDGTNIRNSFYWRGCSGLFAYIISWYIWLMDLSKHIDSIFNAETIEEQKMIYETYIKRKFWTPILIKFLRSPFILSFLNGIPSTQQKLMDKSVTTIPMNAIDIVLSKLSLKNNYFYRVYLYGKYTKECCPEFLKEENFNKLKDGLINRISIHTTTITNFLKEHQKKDISRFILLDHMDWMVATPNILAEEWQQILDNSTEDCRYIWRTVSSNSIFVDNISITYKGKATTVNQLITYKKSLATKLHKVDRVHSYNAFFIAHLHH